MLYLGHPLHIESNFRAAFYDKWLEEAQESIVDAFYLLIADNEDCLFHVLDDQFRFALLALRDNQVLEKLALEFRVAIDDSYELETALDDERLRLE